MRSSFEPRRASARLPLVAAYLASTLGCAAVPESGDDPWVGATLEDLSLRTTASGSCTTDAVRGLADQLVEEMACVQPGLLARTDGLPGVVLAPGVYPALQNDAAEALANAAAGASTDLVVTSGLSTLPEQYLRYRWYTRGLCGARAASAPGRSNEESGIGIAIEDPATWRASLEAAGWGWLGAANPTRFDFLAGDDVRGTSIRAFQRLWNRNNARDRIAEDGLFGPQTNARLARAPAEGFPVGALCGDRPAPAGSSWQSVYAGLTLSGSEIPRAGLANGTLRATLGLASEPLGDVVTVDGRAMVSGRVSWFGGPADSGIGWSDTGAISGERMRSMNSPMSPSAADLASRPSDFYYVAMRVSYSPNGTAWWATQRLLVVSPTTGAAVVVRFADWGPNTYTGRIVDLSPQALTDLGLVTDDSVWVAFAPAGTPVGPVR